MKLSSVLCLASTALSIPIVTRQAAITDTDILQFALTLEHLENVFYKQALQMFPVADFTQAGFSESFFNNLGFVAQDEESHVATLTSAISAAGGSPVAACEYSFGFTDVKSFVNLAAVLEGVGNSAYLGAAPLVQSKDILTVAGSTLVTESLHTALLRENVGLVAAANPQGTPLGANEVFTLASAFIKSCPTSNAALPFKAFPALTATNSSVGAETVITLETTAATSGPTFVTFINGLSTTSIPASAESGTMTSQVPPIAGQTYVVLTNAAVTGSVADEQVIAGPLIVEVIPSTPVLNQTLLR